MVFEMLTNNFLFKPKKGEGYGKSDDHLALMIVFNIFIIIRKHLEKCLKDLRYQENIVRIILIKMVNY